MSNRLAIFEQRISIESALVDGRKRQILSLNNYVVQDPGKDKFCE